MGAVADAPVTLFTAPISPYATRVRIALNEKGIAYTQIDIDFANKPTLMLEANPIWKKVPTIIHNGKPVAESLIIMEYLEDEWPQQVPLMPEGAHQKSEVRFWADYVTKSFDHLLETMTAKAGSPELEAAQKETIKFLKTLETAMTSYSTEGPFFMGATFGFLDVVLAPWKDFILRAEKVAGLVVPGPEEIPRFHKCIEAIVARPSYKAVVPSEDYFLAVYDVIVAAATAAAASK